MSDLDEEDSRSSDIEFLTGPHALIALKHHCPVGSENVFSAILTWVGTPAATETPANPHSPPPLSPKKEQGPVLKKIECEEERDEENERQEKCGSRGVGTKCCGMMILVKERYVTSESGRTRCADHKTLEIPLQQISSVKTVRILAYQARLEVIKNRLPIIQMCRL